MIDKRINKTKRNIEKTFFSLLEKNSVEEITVKMICASAEISRSTFYDHYEAYTVFLKSIDVQLVDKMVDCLNLYDYNMDTNNMLNNLFDMMKKNRSLFSFAFDDRITSDAQKLFIDRARPGTLAAWSKHSSLPNEELELIYYFFMNACFPMLKLWFNHDLGISEERFKDIYDNILKYGVYNYLYK